MTARQHIGIRGHHKVTSVDLTRYVYGCIVCPWQVQAGYRARSDLGGAQALADALAWAGHEHIQEAHADDDETPVLVDEAGDRHEVASDKQGAIMAQRLPDWWVDRG